MINTFKKFLKSFTYAAKGAVYCVKTQRNLRVHLMFMSFMFFFLLRYDFFQITRTQFAVLVVTCALVIALEFVNTAVESVVDLLSPGYNKLAGVAKDVAAGAVLVAAAGAVAVGLIIMLQPEAFVAMGRFYASHILELALVICAVVLGIIWIFYPRKSEKKENKKK